jgi:hypothetical protein
MSDKTEESTINIHDEIRKIVDSKSNNFEKYMANIIKKDDVKLLKDLHHNCHHALASYGDCLDDMMEAATELAQQHGMDHPETLEYVTEQREKIQMVKEFLVELKNDYDKEYKKISKYDESEFDLQILKENTSPDYAICDIVFTVKTDKGDKELFKERCVFQRAAFPHSKGKVPLAILFETMRRIRKVEELLWCSEDDIL